MILEEIYRGNFAPSDVVYPSDPEYQKLNQKINDLSEKLMCKLDQEDQKQLDELIKAIYSAQCLESEEFFKFAFSVGMQLERETRDQYAILQQRHC